MPAFIGESTGERGVGGSPLYNIFN